MNERLGSPYSEDSLVEQPVIQLFQNLQWETENCFNETFLPGGGSLGRETPEEVVLVRHLKPALIRLNQDLPHEVIDLATAEIIRDRSTMSPVNANREIYQMLKEGVRVQYRNPQGETVTENIKIIDWNNPKNNDYFLASQLWISGDLYKRRTDLLGFVNGIPLVFIELKASHKDLKKAFKDNFRDYKTSISQLFWYNGIVILSNGTKSVIGTITSEWEHFNEWKRINSEGEVGIVSIETMVRGACDKEKLLDLIENFTLFVEIPGGTAKVIAKNHQFLGVNNAIEALKGIRKNQGRLGVFWHTQGSGKSYSMIFFSQKVLRKISGNWTFVIVTDRLELDDQIYQNFAHSGAVRETQARAESGEDLQRLLKEDHRYLFTLIQKFRTDREDPYPLLTSRSDIIVIADEAHRTQYDTLALNMRTALPNAAFIAFTGTPLIQTEEKTREVFGDYVSVYTYRQSTEDGATVPLYYENRIPELQLTNLNINKDIEAIIEAAELDSEQEKKLEREFSRDYHLITRDDRLEQIAKDIVTHFTGRGYQGKAMMVSIDKATAVKMYDKVQKNWREYLKDLETRYRTTQGEERENLGNLINLMHRTDMAVVVSQSQNEIEDLREKGVDIITHRARMVREDLATKFKDPDDQLRLVFVCAMWLTGFDAPACSTIYLDKPMKNHTLMQTIARANRVFGEKNNGLIVDYYGVFKDLQKALAIYAPVAGEDDSTPIKDKSQLIALLKQVLAETQAFCEAQGINVQAIITARDLQKLKLLDDAVASIIVNDTLKQTYQQLSSDIKRLFRAIKPDPIANELIPQCMLYLVLSAKIRELTPTPDITDVITEIDQLLDRSIAAEGYIIRPPELLDLSQLNLDVLRQRIEKQKTQQKRIELEKLRSIMERKITQMVKVNRTRTNYLEKFQQMIAEYNAGSMNIEDLFKQLVRLSQELQEEEKRAIRENLTEEELTFFDLLTRPDLHLSKKEEDQVKGVVKDLLEILKREKLVLDWRKRQQTRATVRLCIEDLLDHLPEKYDKAVYQQKCDAVYQYVFDTYPTPTSMALV